MAVTWAVDNTRGSVYLFDPADIKIRPELNGRHEAPDVEPLIASIIEHGQLQPVMVRNEGDVPVLVAGFSRWTAISEINRRKLTQVPVKVQAVYVRCNEQEGYLRNWQENRARNQTTPMDDAHHFAQLERWGMDAKQIAEKLHVTVGLVKRRLKLIEATAEVQAAVQAGTVPVTAAVKLGKLSAEGQRAALRNGKVTAADATRAVGGRVRPKLQAVKEFVEVRMAAAGTTDATRRFCTELLEYLEGGGGQ